MSNLSDMIKELETIAENPKQSILNSMKQTGKKAVGCFPIYTPEEIVYAAGMLPVGMWGGQTTGQLNGKYLQTFCCSIMKSNTEQALLGQYDFLSAVIVTTYCDTLKCIVENWKAALPKLKIIPIVYPQNRKIAAGKEFLKDEFLRIKDELEIVVGNKISDDKLEESIRIYDDYRSTMDEFVDLVQYNQDIISPKTRHLIIKAAYFMDKKVYTQKIKMIIEYLRKTFALQFSNKKIVISGLICEPNGVYDIFKENNLTIIADDLAHESRQFRTISPEQGNAIDRMVERISMQDACSFLFDEAKSRGKFLIDLVKKYNADGIIYCQLKFCDPEEFDYPIIKKEIAEAKIPLLYIEIEQQMDSLEQLRTRIQSFAEILQS